MKRRPEKFCLTLTRAGDLPPGQAVFAAADGLTQGRLKARRLGWGEIVFAELRKPRNPGFHRLAHAIGGMAADNIDGFSGMTSHQALKRLQMESGAGCEEIAYLAHGQHIVQRIPLSLSYESMDELEFQGVMRAICKRLTHYWPDCSEDEILQMAEQWERAA